MNLGVHHDTERMRNTSNSCNAYVPDIYRNRKRDSELFDINCIFFPKNL